MNQHDQQTPPRLPSAISLQQAAVVRSGRTIWSQGSFSIPTGSITAIVGTNGAGKTTLMQAELGLLPLSSGSISVLGQPAGKATQSIGYVPQSYTTEVDSNLSVEQSVLLGVNGTRFGLHRTSKTERAQAKQAMDFTGISDRAQVRLSELSGGLRQRVAIAQALASQPQLLMLDEPLANLDLASQRESVQVLARLNQELGMTIQVVAHDLNMLLPILDGAVYLLDGHPHYARIGDVLDGDLLTHLYGTQVEVVTTAQGQMFISPTHTVSQHSGHHVEQTDAIASSLAASSQENR
ncbi:ABC transporter ATP-binding protein [Bombiscardovia nodaiensis]|uniref:ABC transporter ATP-binding protein n=1 Tax=Bombiscardovia nodaiensis TaxID=2932181 RepID=A0ABN6S9N4_9BIFI|nr:ABC transporter ATP-binding protein [Bombiscardovia nodaiensis]